MKSEHTLSLALLLSYFGPKTYLFVAATRQKYWHEYFPNTRMISTQVSMIKHNAGAVNFNYQPSAGYLRRFHMFISSYKTEDTRSRCCPVTWYVLSNKHFDGGKRAYLTCQHTRADTVSFKLAINMNNSSFFSFTLSVCNNNHSMLNSKIIFFLKGARERINEP
jgi:hypothetical protein